MCLAYGVFLLAEISNLSGIVAALSAGAVTTIYVKHNLTPQGSALCMTVIRALARFTETIIRAPVGERAGGFVLGLKTSTLMALGRQFCLRA